MIKILVTICVAIALLTVFVDCEEKIRSHPVAKELISFRKDLEKKFDETPEYFDDPKNVLALIAKMEHLIAASPPDAGAELIINKITEQMNRLKQTLVAL